MVLSLLAMVCKSCSEPCGGKGDSDMLQRWMWLWYRVGPGHFLVLRLTLRSEICLMELEVLGKTTDHVMRLSSRYYLLCCYCCCLLIMLVFNVVSYEELCPPLLWLSSIRDVMQDDSCDFTVLSPRGVISPIGLAHLSHCEIREVLEHFSYVLSSSMFLLYLPVASV